MRMMNTCSESYTNVETKLCALKEIRGELDEPKEMVLSFSKEFEASNWDPEECS